MVDKSINIILAAAFGIPGLAIMIMAWLLPDLGGERIVAFIAGAVGLIVCAIQVLAFFRSAVKEDAGRAAVRVTAEDRF